MEVYWVSFMFRWVLLSFRNVLYFFFFLMGAGRWGQKTEATKIACFIQDRSTVRFLPQHKGFLGLCWRCGYICVITSVHSLTFLTFCLGMPLIASGIFLSSVLTLCAIMIFHVDYVFTIGHFLSHFIFFSY